MERTPTAIWFTDRAPSYCGQNITAGKRYEILEDLGDYFRFRDDVGNKRLVMADSNLIDVLFTVPRGDPFDASEFELIQHPNSVGLLYKGQTIAYIDGEGMTALRRTDPKLPSSTTTADGSLKLRMNNF